ncbi:MAG: T9SS type A sorting domain-containing protein [Bacteroidia bacterium]
MQSIRNKYLLVTLCLLFCSAFQKEFSAMAQPVITSQPTSVTTCSNTTALFCVSTSAGSPTYQWKMCSTPGGSYVNVANGTPAGATYAYTTSSCMEVTFSSLTTYYYKCDVTSGGTTTTNSVSLTTVAGSGCGTGAKTYGFSSAAGNLDRALDLVEASDGNGVVMVGESSGIDPTGWSDACIFKINTTMNGGMTWCRGLGSSSGGNEDNFNAVIKNTSGNYIVTGQVMDASNSLQLYLAEFPKAGGGATWTRKIGKADYEWGNALIQHSNGDYYVAGYSTELDGSLGTYNGEIYSGRFNSTGTKQWTRYIGFGTTIGATPDEAAYGIVETGSGTTAGDIILIGNTTKVSSTTNEEIAIIRQNSSGTLLSARALAPSSGTGNDVGTCIKRVSTGGYIICGYTNSSGAGGYDFYVAKLNDDATLSVAWQKTIGRSGQDDYAWKVIETSDGGFVIAGYTESTSTFYDDGYVVKLSSVGALLWTRIINFGGSTVDDVIYSITEMSDGTLTAAGFTKSDPDSDILLVALASDGTITSSCTNSTGGTLNTPSFVYNDLSDHNADAAGTSGTETTNNNNITSWLLASNCGVIVLPVELKDFSIKCNGDNRIFSWTTASEQNNKEFTIEHSREGKHWKQFGKHKGAGNSIKDQTYKAAFKENDEGYKYYRLIQTDYNGNSSVASDIIYANCAAENEVSFQLFPNPASGQVTLAFGSINFPGLKVDITDVFGRTVKAMDLLTSPDSNDFIIDISDLAEGAYLVKATETGESGNTFTTKLIKN